MKAKTSLAVAVTPRVLSLAWWAQSMALVARDATRYWYLSFPLGAVWVLAYLRVFLDPTPRVPLLFNWTPSLPYKLAWLREKPVVFAPGDFVIYSFDGAAKLDYPGLKNQPFFKIVRGVAGDRVAVSGRDVFVNGRFVGRAKEKAFDGRPMYPIAPGVIPHGKLYVQGTDKNSFDSRYRSSGLVDSSRIIGQVVPLF